MRLSCIFIVLFIASQVAMADWWVRPFFPCSYAYYAVRNKYEAEKQSGYLCEQAAEDYLRELKRKGYGDAEIVYLHDKRQRYADFNYILEHAVVFCEGRYYDPINNKIFAKIPSNYLVISK